MLASPAIFKNMKGDLIMETKNVILSNYATALSNMAVNFAGTVNSLGNNADENAATIKTLNILLESVRSELVIIQGALDSYPE